MMNNIKINELKAPRDAFGEALLEEGAKNKNLVVIDCDLSGPTRTEKFAKAYPKRFFQMGIQEANAIGVAAGLAHSGFRPFICSFACFITGRYDQIRVSIANDKAPVVIVGTHGGLAIGKDGATQMGLEDINLMRGLPNMQVIQPVDFVETKSVVKYLSASNGAAYLRIGRTPVPIINKPDYKFNFGKGICLAKGKNLTIMSSGALLHHAFEAVKKAASMGITVNLFNIHTIKPLDKNIILKAAKETKGIITIEDHSIIGGLGTAVAEVIAEKGLAIPVKRCGINDVFGESGEPADLYKKHKLDKKGLFDIIMKFYKKLVQ